MKPRQRWELHGVRRRLKRLDRRRSTPDLNDAYAAAAASIDRLVNEVGPQAVSEELLVRFDEYCATYAATWKTQVHEHFHDVLTELSALYAKVRPQVDREGVIVGDLRARLADRDKAVTDALYRTAKDDGLRDNPLRNDPRHANPPHQTRESGSGE